MVSQLRSVATLSIAIVALLHQSSLAQEASTGPVESSTSPVCEQQSTNILTSFASNQDRVTRMLSLGDDCAGSGIYEARLLQLFDEARRFEEGEALRAPALALDSAYEKEILAALAQLALSQSNKEEATVYVRELLQQYPEWPHSLISAARVARAEHQYSAAMLLVETANGIEETSEGILLQSSLHYSEGEYEAALERFDDALRRDPSAMRLTQSVLVAAFSFKELGRREEGRQLLARHVEALPHLRRDQLVAFARVELSGPDDGPSQPSMISSRSNSVGGLESLGTGGEPMTPPRVDPNAQRTSEEIEYVFDRNKGAIFALYNRALRRNQQLGGRAVFRIRILPEGRVDSCEVADSELDDEQLLDQLCRRILLFRFEELSVIQSITVNKPIDFVPQ